MSAPTHIWTGSALSIPAASGPSSFNVNRAMDWALYNERAADSGVRDGNSASRADSRLIRRPGLMSTSWHSRRALGRGHEHIRRSPMVTANRPSSWTLIANGLPSCWARVAATLNIVSRWSPQASGGQPIAEMSCPPRWQTTRATAVSRLRAIQAGQPCCICPSVVRDPCAKHRKTGVQTGLRRSLTANRQIPQFLTKQQLEGQICCSRMEPPVGIEPTTPALPWLCSAD